MKKLFSVGTIILTGSLLLQLSTFCFHLHGAAGDVDLSFDPGSGVNSAVNSVAVQSDGKVLIAGAGDPTRLGIGRLTANGSADGNFNPGTAANYDVVSFALQPDGKILLGGSFTTVNGTNRLALARLHTDGGLDGSFNPCIPCLIPYDGPYGGEYSTAVTTVLLQADGKILVAGYNDTFYTVEEGSGSTMRFFVVRFLANGSPDPAFTPFGGEPTEGGYWFYGWRSYPVSALAVQLDGKIILSAERYSVNDTNLTGMARLNANGTRDNSFTPGIGRYASVDSLRLRPDGMLLLAGSFGIVNGTNRSGICRLQANGSLDSNFNPGIGPNAMVSAFALQPDGKIMIGGSFPNINGTNRNHIARLDANGSLDSSFNPDAGPNAKVSCIALQPDGKVLIGGDFTTVNGVVRPHVARLYGDSVAPSLNIVRSNAFVILSWPVTGKHESLPSEFLVSGWAIRRHQRRPNLRRPSCDRRIQILSAEVSIDTDWFSRTRYSRENAGIVRVSHFGFARLWTVNNQSTLNHEYERSGNASEIYGVA